MPLDPSIVSNAFANISMPDMNALMQQRVRGAENIYQTETGRQEQAAQAEKEAAKAQEAATIKALLPAYTYGIQTGDLVGAGDLVPPELRPQIQQYIDALEGRSPQEVQAALIGSLSSSPMGQEALSAIQRGQNAQIQMGQLDVSRQDLVLRRQKQALDARGEGNWDWKEGVDANGQPAYMWVNPRTRQVVPADVTGGAAPNAIPAPDVVTPRQPMPGAPEVAPPPAGAVQPPAKAVQPPAFRPKPKAASAEQTQEERRRAAAVRYSIKNVDKVLQTIDKDPASFGQGADEFFLSLVPFGAAEDFKSFVQDANRQQVYYRMNQTVATMLRLATGAAYTGPELVTEANSFMPKYGDAPATARDKLDALEDRILSEVGSTGRGFTPEDQAELDTLLDVFATMKDKLYPVGDEAVDSELPEGTTSSNWK